MRPSKTMVKLGWPITVIAAVMPSVAWGQVHVGPGAEGVSAIGHVAVPEVPKGVVAAGLDVGYQLIEALDGETGAHHGGTAALGVAATVTNWFQVGAAWRGGFLSHPDDAQGADSSGYGTPSLKARVINAKAPLAYGLELTGAFPGRDAPSLDFKATTLRASALLSYSAPNSPWRHTLNVGYVWDNTANAAPPIASMRQGDRIALIASSYDAVAIGVAEAYRSGPWLVYGELSGELLPSAPNLASSPVRVAIGGRYNVSEMVDLEARAQVGLSSRPDLSRDVYQVYEPRFAFLVGPRFTFGAPSQNAPVVARDEVPPEPVVAEEPTPVAVVIERSLTGVIADQAGAPLPQVTVTARQREWVQSTETDANGAFEFTSVPAGAIDVEATTVDYQPRRLNVVVAETEELTALETVRLEEQVLGAQIEGVVRGFDGRIPAATVTLSPGNISSSTDGEGKFRIELAPGQYQVTVTSEGYQPQTRTVTVQAHGVVIVNVDLRKR